MKKSELEKVVIEAERFLEKAKLVLEQYKATDHDYIYSSKDTASLKRSSLDLTRQLAQMRKPN